MEERKNLTRFYGPGYQKLIAAVSMDCKKDGGSVHPEGCTGCAGAHCFHKYCNKLKWILERADMYAKALGYTPADILNMWEKDRTYWYMNYYQECEQPEITGDRVRVFETEKDFRDSIGNKGFRCPSCGKVTDDPCECKKCGWKVYGLLKDLGKGVFVMIKDSLKSDTIFMPVAWEQEFSNKEEMLTYSIERYNTGFDLEVKKSTPITDIVKTAEDWYRREFDVDIYEDIGAFSITDKTNDIVYVYDPAYDEWITMEEFDRRYPDPADETAPDEEEKENEINCENDYGSGLYKDDRDIGKIVKHFKRNEKNDCGSMRYMYKIIGFAQHTETNERLVIYQAMYDDQKMFARPFDVFYSKVDKTKYPDIKQEYRFERCR